MSIANQFEQMMIFDLLDFVRQADKAAINIVERAAVELVAELFAAQAKRMTPRVLTQHEF